MATEAVPMNKLPPLPRRVVPTIAVHVQQTPAGPVEVADATPQAATPAPAAGSVSRQPRSRSGSETAWKTRTASGLPTAPDDTSSRMRRWVAAPGRWWLTARTTPAAAHASTTAQASASDSASGFSHSTCRPAAAAATACGRCSSLVVLM